MHEPSRPGLTANQAREALEHHGPNALPEQPAESFLHRYLRQFRNPVIYILLFALAFDLAIWWQEGADDIPLEAVTILVILLFNSILGAWQETKSEAALARLKALAAPRTWVLRDGCLVQLPSVELVPGDLIRIEAGERIPADGTLESANSFSADESILTGESVPLEKSIGDLVLSGTLAVRGLGWIRIAATGQQSTMGKLAHLLQSVEREQTPLERRLAKFGRQVAICVIGLAALVLLAGMSTQGFDDINRLLLFAVALAVAAVPESLPAVLTLAMALGMERMAARKAVVRKLTAVEALGSVTVIATDKTGTLTENHMRVESLDSEQPSLALRAMVLVNDADATTRAGDPLELGLLDYAASQGLDIAQLRQQCPRKSEKPFDAAWKYMRVTVLEDGQCISYYKGAPEMLLGLCTLTAEQRQICQATINRHAARGYRLLALAREQGANETGLQWLGTALLWDPPRPEVADAIARCRSAGVRVLMITGDHPATARAIADHVDIQAGRTVTGDELSGLSTTQLQSLLMDATVFARVKPEHKLAIVQALQAGGDVVAVTGDGVNDAPALKAADVGVAMGLRGSDVSREVADLVLLDDNFSTIVAAIEEGRSIYENIQKFIRTLFSTNVTEVMLIAIGAMLAFYFTDAGVALLLPLTAAQVLWVNLLTDSLPALAITTDTNPGLLRRRPRKAVSPLMDPATLIYVFLVGGVGGIVALLLYWWLPASGTSPAEAQTVVFCYLVFVQMTFVPPARRVNVSAVWNRWVFLALLVGVVAQLAALLNDELGRFVSVEKLSASSTGVLAVSVTLSWLVAEATALALRRRRSKGW